MALTEQQRRVLRELKAAPSYRRAPTIVKKALIEAGLVESNLSTPNQAASDRDSEGALQQRPSTGWGPTTESNTTDAEQFLRRAIPLAGKYSSSGQLAQAVQRSAFPARYNERSGEAQSLLGGGGGGGTLSGGSATTNIPGQTITTQIPTVDKAGFEQARKLAIVGGLIAKRNPNSFLLRSGLLSTQEPTLSDFTGSRTVKDVIPGATVRTPAGAMPSVSGGIDPRAKHGVPVAHETSVGGPHPTAGLAGYPARDYFAKPGTAAVAPVDGKVIRLSGHDPAQGPTQGPHGPLGYSVYIQGSDGHTYFLTHMGSRNVKPGQRVRAGQRIGTVANYDKYGTPSHIHMGVR